MTDWGHADPRVSERLVADPADVDLRLDQFLTARLPKLSRSQVQRLIRDGHVRVDRGHVKSGLAVTDGLVVDVDIPAPVPATPLPEALPLSILYDDDDVVVIDKPAGMVVHPAAGHASGTLVNALLHHVRGLSGIGGTERPGLVHRLDRGTSGVMVVAKHDQAHRDLARQFHDRLVEKQYIALVWGAPVVGLTMSRPIGRDPRTRQKMSSRGRHTRTASTRIEAVEPLRGLTLVRVAIATGRTHQIRVHLSEGGHPIAGDALYGGVHKRLPPHLAALASLDRPFLHAWRLTFAHPRDGRSLSFAAPLPADLDRVLTTLRRASARPASAS